MNLARRRGFEVDGIDPSAWASDYARRKYGIAVRRGTFDEASIEPGSFGVVTMIDIIEHVAHPGDAIRKAADILGPGGLLCLVTPNAGSFAARLAGRFWWHYRPAHLAYFNRRSLETLLRRSGFSVVSRKAYVWTFSAAYLTSRKKFLRFLLRSPRLASFLKRIPIKLALGDSFEIYARKVEGS